MQPLRGLAACAPRHAIRAQPRPMQRFVRVDVADAGDRRLVEQDRLQRGPAFAKPLVKLFWSEVRVDWFGPQKRHRLRREQLYFRAGQQAAEASGISVSELVSSPLAGKGAR